MSQLKTIILYDQLNTPYGGAELVIKNLAAAFPEADWATSVANPQVTAKLLPKQKIITTFLQKIPVLHHHHRLLAPLTPLAFESLDLSQYQVIISLSSSYAKGALTKPHQLHLCYLLTPTRYLFSHEQFYLSSRTILQIWPISAIVNKIIQYLKSWDLMAASRPDFIIPISKLVANRVQKYYHRLPSQVIYPPIKIASENNEQQNLSPKQLKLLKDMPAQFYLIVSRLVAYKRFDLAIAACAKLHKNLLIIGTGPDEKYLQQQAKRLLTQNTTTTRQAGDGTAAANSAATTTIRFLGQQPDDVKNYLLAHCQALLLPGIEDFGISALEANSFGKPALIHSRSGAAELIKDQVHGIHLSGANLEPLCQAIKKLETTNYNQAKLKQNALKYSEEHFQTQIRAFVAQAYLSQATLNTAKKNNLLK